MQGRSSKVKVVPTPFFPRLSATATVTLGHILKARRTTSMWPKVMGSNVPGTRTWLIRSTISTSPEPQQIDARLAIALLLHTGEPLELESRRGGRALEHHDGAVGEQAVA